MGGRTSAVVLSRQKLTLRSTTGTLKDSQSSPKLNTTNCDKKKKRKDRPDTVMSGSDAEETKQKVPRRSPRMSSSRPPTTVK